MNEIARTRPNVVWLIALLASAVGLLAAGNGVAMLVMPKTWFWSVDGVSSTGGYNAHFIRDIGMVYVLSGAAMFAGVARPAQRVLLWSAAAAPHNSARCAGRTSPANIAAPLST